MVIEIEKNVPMPDRLRKGRQEIYPLRGMEVGDSFFVPLKAGMSQQSVSGAIQGRARKLGIKLSTNRRVENDVDGVRVWRVE